jgi:hypothetical protein
MKPKLAIIIYLLMLCVRIANAQSNDVERNISIAVIVPNNQTERISEEVRNLLDNRLTQATTINGVGELMNSDDYSFILYPDIVNITKDITPTAPVLYVYNIEVNLYVINGTLGENGKAARAIVFASKTISLKGVGDSETKAYMNAFKKLNSKDPSLQSFIQDARKKIFKYFSENCDVIMFEAEQLAREASLSINNDKSQKKDAIAEMKFAQGLNLLKNIRVANTACYKKNMSKMDNILDKYDQFACNYYLSMAKNAWYINRGFAETKAYLDKIPPSMKCRTEVESLLKTIQAERVTDESFRKEIDRWNAIDSQKRELDVYVDIAKSISQNKKEEIKQYIQPIIIK